MKIFLAQLFLLALVISLAYCTGNSQARAAAPNADAAGKGVIVKEQYEWCNIWWDNANDRKSPRVLLIGDSISVGYSARVTELLAGKARVDRLGVSFGISDPALLKQTAFMLSEYKYAAIQFNNGLHGGHITDSEYESSLRNFAKSLKKLSGNAALIWASSTPVTMKDDPQTFNSSQNSVVKKRNEIAAGVMSDLGIPINDLYGAVVDNPELKSSDGCHFNSEGYNVLGSAVARALMNAIGQ